MGASIFWATAKADTQFTILDLSAFKKQCLISLSLLRGSRFPWWICSNDKVTWKIEAGFIAGQIIEWLFGTGEDWSSGKLKDSTVSFTWITDQINGLNQAVERRVWLDPPVLMGETLSGYYSEKLSAERLRRVYDLAPARVKRYLDSEIEFVLKRINPGDRVLELTYNLVFNFLPRKG